MLTINEENLKKRAENLSAIGLNALDFLIVTLQQSAQPREAYLKVFFYNNKQLDEILHQPETNYAKIFPIAGGTRILAGNGPGHVKVTNIQGNPNDNFLKLTVSPVGDYSTYTLSVNYDKFDPHPSFSGLNFKFRPGCFNIDCKPEWNNITEVDNAPVIDYLAKDFDSFKHVIISSMMQRVPGWHLTSEADLDQVLLELFSAAGDELSDLQDRVMNEAYFTTAKKRISLARLGMLMSYYVHQGNQAHTYLALKVKNDFELDQIFEVWTGYAAKDEYSVTFHSKVGKTKFFKELNNIKLYTWNNSVVALSAGTTCADLEINSPTKFRDLINKGDLKHLILQVGDSNELPTQAEPFIEPSKRQLLTLKKAEAMTDPMTGKNFLRVWWNEKLDFNICGTVRSPGGTDIPVSLFHGNLLSVYQGLTKTTIFKDSAQPVGPGEFHYSRTGCIDSETDDENPYHKTGCKDLQKEDESYGNCYTVCELHEQVLYLDTPTGGTNPALSTLHVEVQTPDGVEQWSEKSDLVHSTSEDKDYVVEKNEDMSVIIRFGNLPDNAVIMCTYDIGLPLDGNIGAEKLINFDGVQHQLIEYCWNPFDVNNGRDMEAAEDIIRRVPEAYKYHQKRAITLQDYVERVEEVDRVAKASAEYQYTGSWTTVRISVDPIGTTEIDDALRTEITEHLDAMKLLGEDFEIRKAHYVPLEIEVTFCVDYDYWIEDLRFLIEQEFSTEYTSDGRPAFFNPDVWTFGQSLYRSQIIGRLESIAGVDHVLDLKMKKIGEAWTSEDMIKVQNNEIVQVSNDHDRIENGYIHFFPKGGRR